jgi:hypothetical protein
MRTHSLIEAGWNADIAFLRDRPHRKRCVRPVPPKETAALVRGRMPPGIEPPTIWAIMVSVRCPKFDELTLRGYLIDVGRKSWQSIVAQMARGWVPSDEDVDECVRNGYVNRRCPFSASLYTDIRPDPAMRRAA